MTRNQIILKALRLLWNTQLDGIVQDLRPEDFDLLEALITECEIEVPVKNQKMEDFRWLLKDSR